MKAQYKRQGTRLYKVVGTQIIEVELASYEYGIIGIIHSDNSPFDMPNKHAKRISKTEFEKYYNEGMTKLIALHKPITAAK